MYSFWEPNFSEQRCELSQAITKFSIYNAEDYKKCACKYFADDIATNCPQIALPEPPCEYQNQEQIVTTFDLE